MISCATKFSPCLLPGRRWHIPEQSGSDERDVHGPVPPPPCPVGIGISLSSTRNLILLYNVLGTSWDEHYNDHRPWFSVGGQDRERGALGYQKVDVGGMSTPHPLSRKESLMEERIHGLHLIIVLWWWQENDRHIFGGVLKSFLK